MSVIETIFCAEDSHNSQPVWIKNQASLFWVERCQQRLYQYHQPSQEVTHCALDTPILNLSPRIKNGFIATLKDGIGFFDHNSRQVIYISKPEPFYSDYETTGGTVDRDGHYWTTCSSRKNASKHNHLYQLSPNLSIDRFAHNRIESAAEPAFSKDGKTLYQSAKAGGHIYATTLNKDRQPVSTDVFCRISKSEGTPRGLCVDSEDNVWVCHFGGSCVSCYDKTGQRIEKIMINAINVMHCTFGGNNLDTLFIATKSTDSHLGLAKKQSMTGCILSTQPGVKGLETNYFSG